MASAKFQSIITLFTEDDSPRVWSLLVTMFGDLAQEEGHTLSGGLLGRMTQSVGIKPEATRVALHRLRKEGWLNSERSGRTSAYSLTEWGRAETIAATPIIYAFEEPVKAAWLVIPEVGSVDEAFAVAPKWCTTGAGSCYVFHVCRTMFFRPVGPGQLVARRRSNF